VNASAGDTPRVALRRLQLRDFRNFGRQDVELPAEGMAIVGENGHGKTNLLEAIYYLQLLRSVRGARDVDLVRFGAAGFHVSAEAVLGDGRRREIAVGFERAGRRKRVRLDGSEPARLSEALGALPSVIFSPGDVALVAGAPSERRRYLDVALALTSRRYLAALQAYRGALVRRNAALRETARRGGAADRAAVWEPALAEHGATLRRERVAWVAHWSDELTRLCRAIGERGAVRMRYASAQPLDGDLAAALRATLEAKREHDVRRGITGAGPHRDELELTLAVPEGEGEHAPDGPPRELRVFGSAGQQRTAAIALRMLEAATLREASGALPLFLLDDPFAELDARRAHRILELLDTAGLGQTILVVPRESDIPPELTRLERRRIVQGVLAPATAPRLPDESRPMVGA
jgi:DNA replication and repair protein RecF